MSNFVTTTWDKDLHFISDIDDMLVHFDAIALSRNNNRGVSPKTILLSGLSACTGMDVVALLKKFKAPFAQFRIDAKGELTEEHPKVYHAIHITYAIKIDEVYRPKVEEAVRLSLESYCGVAAMMSKTAAITHEIQYL